MKSTRCKFACISVLLLSHGREVTLAARYDERVKEDQSFAQATPTGDVKFLVTNPAAFDLFAPGKEFYLDITEVEKPEVPCRGPVDPPRQTPPIDVA